MAASTITYTDKVKVIDPDRDATELWRSVDANEVKTVVNSHATLLDTNTSAIATNTSDISTNTTAIATKLTASNNLSDLTNAATARTNLGVVAQTGDESLRAYRPIGTTITSSGALTSVCSTANTFYQVDSSGAGVAITLSDAVAAAVTAGWEWEFFLIDASNGLEFSVSGSQSIISVDSFTISTTDGAGILLKYLGSNSWALMGRLDS